MGATLDIWKSRDQSLNGKVILSKVLGDTHLLIVMDSISIPSKDILKARSTLFGFLWNGKRHHIKSNTLTGDRNNGGLRMVDLELQNKAFKLAYMMHIIETDAPLGNIPKSYFEKYGGLKCLLKCNYDPFVVTSVETVYHVETGDTVVLECSLDNQGADFPYVIECTIENIQADDDGFYDCRIGFLNGQNDKLKNNTWVQLIVSAPPTFSETSPSRVTFTPGSDMVLHCQATGNPPPSVLWKKGGTVLVTSLRTTVTANSLTVHKVGPSDNGAYTCAPHFVVMPANLTVNENAEAILECEAEGSPSIITYHWFKNGNEIESYSNMRERLEYLLDGTLLIHSVQPSDEGWFTCRPTNGVGNPPVATAYLQVLFAAYVDEMPAHTYIPIGLKGTITCNIRANPPFTEVVWTKDWVQLDNLNGYNIVANGNLVIMEVGLQNEGRYTCTPYNNLGSRGESLPTNVHVRDPPVFITRPRSIYQRELGQQVTFQCAAQGDPKPTIKWTKVNGDIPIDRAYSQNGYLTISYLHKEDHGKYECLAENVVATVATSTNLIIESKYKEEIGDLNWPVILCSMCFQELGVAISKWFLLLMSITFSPIEFSTGKRPGPPHNVLVNETRSGLILYWSKPVNTANEIVGYVVEYKEVGKEWAILEDDIAASELMYTAQNLLPDTHYSFRIFALTQTAFSEPSEVVIAYTGDIPVYYGRTGFPTPITAAIVGALCFLIVISLLFSLGVYRVHKKRKEKKRVTFETGKPSTRPLTTTKPKSQSSAENKHQTRPKLPELKPVLVPFFARLKRSYSRRKKAKPNEKMTSNKGVTVSESLFARKSKVPVYKVEVDYTSPISQISRTIDGKFVLGQDTPTMCATSSEESTYTTTDSETTVDSTQEIVYRRGLCTSSPEDVIYKKPFIVPNVRNVNPCDEPRHHSGISIKDIWKAKAEFDKLNQLFETNHSDLKQSPKKTDSLPQFSRPSEILSGETQGRARRPQTADNWRPNHSAMQLLSRRPSQRTPIYSTASTPSTLRDISSISGTPQRTVSVEIHRSNEEPMDKGEYVSICPPQRLEENLLSTPRRRGEETPIAPIKPMRYNITPVDSLETLVADHNSTTNQQTIKDSDITLTNLQDTSSKLQIIRDMLPKIGDCSSQNRNSITSMSSGRGSRTTTLSRSSRGGSFKQQESSSPGVSSGIGSRTASHSTMSSHQRSASIPSDQISLDSPFSDSLTIFSLQKDGSIDENYEFDKPPESELLHALKQIQCKSSTMKPHSLKDVKSSSDLMPRPRSSPQYEDNEARCAKLKEEFLEFQKQQQTGGLTSQKKIGKHYEQTTMV
uniref:Protein turtle homolog A-like n=1 Tax=Saccoglossus kowalevskii TaxID=10224 RepID=A0ABM0M5M8_SACKO|nr:PREDICTED: protein turtle homolog A-like [Saccoglossus kowalevskii]